MAQQVNQFPIVLLGNRDDIFDPMSKGASDNYTDILLSAAASSGVFYFLYQRVLSQFFQTAPLSGMTAVLAVGAFFAVFMFFFGTGKGGEVKKASRDVATDAQQQIQDNGYRNEWRPFSQFSGIYSLE